MMSASVMRNGLIVLLTLAAWTLSLFFTGYRDIIYAPALLCLLAAALIAVAGSRRLAVPATAVAALLFTLWLYITLSLTWSRVPFASLVTWLVFTSLPLSFFAFSLPADGRLPRWLVLTLLSALTVLGGWAVLQVSVWPRIYGRRAHDPLLNANSLAALLDMGLLPMLALTLHRHERRIVRRLSAAACVILFAGLLATQSRGGLLCALTAALTLGFTMRRTIARRPLRLLGLLSIAAVLLLSMQIAGHAPIAARLTQLVHPAHDTDSAARLAIWRATLRLIAAHPLGGTGFGTFYLYYPSVRPPLTDNSAGNWAHNDPLQFWAECGIAAPLLLYGLMLAVAIRSVRAIRRTEADSAERAAIAGLGAGLLAAAQHAHMEFDFYMLPTLICAGIWLTAWHQVTTRALGGEIKIMTARQWQIFAAGAVCLALPVTLLTVSSAAGEYFYERAQASLAASQIGGFLNNTGRAEKFAPGSFIDPEVALAGFYIDLLAQPTVFFSTAEKDKMFTTARALLDEAAEFNPAWAEIDRKRAKLYSVSTPAQILDGKTQALMSLQAAVSKNPMNFRARQELAQMLIARGQRQDAYNVLAAGLQFPHPDDVTRDYLALMKEIAP